MTTSSLFPTGKWRLVSICPYGPLCVWFAFSLVLDLTSQSDRQLYKRVSSVLWLDHHRKRADGFHSFGLPFPSVLFHEPCLTSCPIPQESRSDALGLADPQRRSRRLANNAHLNWRKASHSSNERERPQILWPPKKQKKTCRVMWQMLIRQGAARISWEMRVWRERYVIYIPLFDNEVSDRVCVESVNPCSCLHWRSPSRTSARPLQDQTLPAAPSYFLILLLLLSCYCQIKGVNSTDSFPHLLFSLYFWRRRRRLFQHCLTCHRRSTEDRRVYNKVEVRHLNILHWAREKTEIYFLNKIRRREIANLDRSTFHPLQVRCCYRRS